MPRGRKSKKKQEQKKLNITVAILIVLSILLAVLIYTKSGYLGQTLSPALGGVLGYIKYLVPIALFAFSLYIAYDKDTKYYLPKIVMFFFILVFIDVIFSCYQISKGNIEYPNDEIMKSIQNTLVLLFTGINGCILLPYTSKTIARIKEKCSLAGVIKISEKKNRINNTQNVVFYFDKNKKVVLFCRIFRPFLVQ